MLLQAVAITSGTLVLRARGNGAGLFGFLLAPGRRTTSRRFGLLGLYCHLSWLLRWSFLAAHGWPFGKECMSSGQATLVPRRRGVGRASSVSLRSRGSKASPKGVR
jgi:hypothetical protein